MKDLFTTKQGYCAVCGAFVVTDERVSGDLLYCSYHWDKLDIEELAENEKIKQGNKEFKNVEKRML